MADMADGYRLLHEGALALSEVEVAGFRVDLPYLDAEIKRTEAAIKRYRDKLRTSKVYAAQRRRYGQKTKLQSRDQLATVLYNDMGYSSDRRTATGKHKLDEAALEQIDHPYAKAFLRLESMCKLHSTYLLGVRSEVGNDGRVHGFFNLNTVRSFRGSADGPNLQNMPVRDPMQGKAIRQAFIPSPGHVLVEIDYSSVEVMVACALSGDPKLTYDATEGDMHRDMAAECFMLRTDQVAKPVRQAAKGGFVFAEFYGDWYKQVARNLWDSIHRGSLVTADGVPLHDHMAAAGVQSLGACDTKAEPVPGTFEHHIKSVEDRFWNQRFLVYHKWRQQQVAAYQANGYIDLATGFRCFGPMTKNQIINYPIQGPSFHCLLWSLTRLVRALSKRKARTKVVCQIHDSIIADVHKDELPMYMDLARDIMTVQVRKHFKWLTVPLSIEAEASDVNWHSKQKLELV